MSHIQDLVVVENPGSFSPLLPRGSRKVHYCMSDVEKAASCSEIQV